MLTIFQVDYDNYCVKVFVLQFPAVFTEFISTLEIFAISIFENSLLDQIT